MDERKRKVRNTKFAHELAVDDRTVEKMEKKPTKKPDRMSIRPHLFSLHDILEKPIEMKETHQNRLPSFLLKTWSTAEREAVRKIPGAASTPRTVTGARHAS